MVVSTVSVAQKMSGVARDWQTESLRLTVFLSPSAQPKGDNWWRELTGAEPETRNARPAVGQLVDTGTFENNSLTLSIQVGRIDWMLGPSQAQLQDSKSEIKAIGEFRDTPKGFLTALRTWFPKCPPVIRVGYGAVLLEPVQTKEAGYQRLGESLSTVEVDPRGSEDFFYQINRPRAVSASMGQMKLNRLSKWSVSSFQPLSAAFALGMAPQYYLGPKIMACRLELDISTPVERVEEIPNGKLPEVLHELMTLGTEIADKGDIP